MIKNTDSQRDGLQTPVTTGTDEAGSSLSQVAGSPRYYNVTTIPAPPPHPQHPTHPGRSGGSTPRQPCHSSGWGPQDRDPWGLDPVGWNTQVRSGKSQTFHPPSYPSGPLTCCQGQACGEVKTEEFPLQHSGLRT